METKNGMNFKEINEINVNGKVEQKNGLSYLSWAWAWAEAKKLDEKANYVIHENADGHAFFESKFGVDVKVSVTMFGVTHTLRLPIMDGANKAMRAEAYTYNKKSGQKTVNACDAMDVNKAIMRCLVKCIAMHGLGLYIYAGEDLPESADGATTDDKKAYVYIVSGKTFDIKDELKNDGWTYNKEIKVYTKESSNPDLQNNFNYKNCEITKLTAEKFAEELARFRAEQKK